MPDSNLKTTSRAARAAIRRTRRAGASAARIGAGAWRGIPRRIRLWIIIVAILTVAASVLAIIFRPAPPPEPAPTVEVEPVSTEDVSIYGEYVGRVRAQQFVEVHARVEGYLEKMLFSEGTFVKKEQTLFVIDPRVYAAKVDRAEAQLNKARTQAQKTKRDLYRIRPLFEQNAASRLDLDNAVAARTSALWPKE